MPETLLRTKLYAPPVRPNLVPRHRLIERLNQDLSLGHRLTLISAPAGFGKTTLAGEWIAGCERPAAWLSLDEGDNDPHRFLTYLVAALQTLDLSDGQGNASAVGEGVLAMLQSPQPPAAESILTALLNEIAALTDNFILVLDDYHLIDAQPVSDALNFLLEHLPSQMHLVIATRVDPPLSLARLRARGQLTELRATDLRFNSFEAAEFLNRVMGLDLSEENVTALETRTEGWIAGLQLAAISMQGQEDPAGFIKSFTGSHRYVLDYLIEEVLNQQNESVQSFLLQTAVLEQLTGSLCDALTGQDNGQQTLAMLDHANLFIIPLDNERRWYRYHHLFAGLLRQRLRQLHPEQIPKLHSRASVWYEQENRFSEAIRHALAAEDFERMADLTELAWPTWRGVVELITWLSWVDVLPEEIIRTRPVLCAAYAQALLNAGKLEAAEVRLRDVERWLEPSAEDLNEQTEETSAEMVVVDEGQFRELPATHATARTYHAQAVGDTIGTVRYAQRVLQLLPEEDYLRRGQIAGLLGLAYWANGNLEEAHQIFADGMAGMQKAGNNLGVIQGSFVLADIKVTLGHLHEAQSTYERALQLAASQGDQMPYGTGEVYTGISRLHRERGELEAAAQALTTSKELGEQIEVSDWQHRWCIAQARLQETHGDLDGALILLDEAQQWYVRTPLPDVCPIAAWKARVLIKQGRTAEVLSWVREQDLSSDDDLSYLREFEHITLARLFIAQYQNDPMDSTVDEAVGLLARLLNAAEDGNRTGSMIEILILQAIAQEMQNSTNAALIPLERAMMLAEPEGYLRIFVDEGRPIKDLLAKTLKRDVLPNYVRRLLAAFERGKAEQPRRKITQFLGPELIEPLSDREIEVLQLIADGLTNREIADRLYLSINTVKVHTRNIYGKLDAHHRTDAVAKARTLGILLSN